jgi:hypothetical protein
VSPLGGARSRPLCGHAIEGAGARRARGRADPRHRGRDEEGSILLHEAIELAWQTGDRPTAVAAYRELGFVEVQVGRAIPLKQPQ